MLYLVLREIYKAQLGHNSVSLESCVATLTDDLIDEVEWTSNLVVVNSRKAQVVLQHRFLII